MIRIRKQFGAASYELAHKGLLKEPVPVIFPGPVSPESLAGMLWQGGGGWRGARGYMALAGSTRAKGNPVGLSWRLQFTIFCSLLGLSSLLKVTENSEVLSARETPFPIKPGSLFLLCD